MVEVHDIVQETGIKNIPMEKKCIKAKWLSGEALQIAVKRRESEVAQSCPTLCDPWTVAYQAPPSMGFSRQEYWSGLPLRPINNKRLLLSKENQISRRKEFSNLLCMGL